MALLCSRFTSKVFRGQLAVPCRFYAESESLPDPMELATGHEKFEKLQKQAGNLDPFKDKPIPRIPNSTRENPNLVPSYFKCRAVACACSPDSGSLVWMWLFQGEPRRCRCGHWFKLESFHITTNFSCKRQLSTETGVKLRGKMPADLSDKFQKQCQMEADDND